MTVEPATDTDFSAYLQLRRQVAQWMVVNGIVQWLPGDLTDDTLRDWIADGELHIARIAGVPVGGVIVMWSDEQFWGDRGHDGTAGYIHGLLIDRAYSGDGLGSRLLEYGEQRIRDAGKPLVRLDAVRSNPVLQRYYRNAGYTDAGTKTFETGKVFAHGAAIDSVTLFEKAV